MPADCSPRDVRRRLARFRDTLDPLPEAPPDVQVVVRALHDRLFDTDLLVKDVLAAFHLSSGRFAARFRWHCGMSMRAYVRAKRVAAACMLIEETSCALGLIGLAVGYEEYRSFARAFKALKGHAPSVYRSRWQERT
jgi:transcriptional regulator GlxA family with amidase domain